MAVTAALEQDKAAGLFHHTVPSWTFEQLERACADPTFFDSAKAKLACPGVPITAKRGIEAEAKELGMEEWVHDRPSHTNIKARTNYKDSLLRAKFYYAGSARWMFNFTSGWRTSTCRERAELQGRIW
jgi:hypothetical protein